LTKGGRKRRHSAILTDTPKKHALEQEKMKSLRKSATKSVVSRKIVLKNTDKKKKSSSKVTKKPAICPSSSAEDWFCIVFSVLFVKIGLIWHALVKILLIFVRTVNLTECCTVKMFICRPVA